MNILEVYFSNGLVSVDHDNWEAKLTKLKPVLYIVNVLGASRFGM